MGSHANNPDEFKHIEPLFELYEATFKGPKYFDQAMASAEVNLKRRRDQHKQRAQDLDIVNVAANESRTSPDDCLLREALIEHCGPLVARDVLATLKSKRSGKENKGKEIESADQGKAAEGRGRMGKSHSGSVAAQTKRSSSRGATQEAQSKSETVIPSSWMGEFEDDK